MHNINGAEKSVVSEKEHITAGYNVTEYSNRVTL